MGSLHFNIDLIDDDMYIFLFVDAHHSKTNSFPTGFALQYIFFIRKLNV